MAEDSRPPHERSGALPRRVPGANGRTPAQVRRGFLPVPAPDVAAQPSPLPSPPPPPPQPGGPLPRRAPGTSAIQPPPRQKPRQLLPEPRAPDSSAAARPAALASTAAPSATAGPPATAGPSATAGPPATAAQPATVVPLAAETPSAAASSTAPRTAPAPQLRPDRPEVGRAERSEHRDRKRPARPARRWRLAGVLIAILLVVLAAVLTAALTRHSALSARAGAPSASVGSQRIAAETAARNQAVAWVTSQVGRDIIVSCDAVICSDLAQHGFPAGNLNVLQPTAPDPYGSDLVIASADVRSQFGGKLVSTYAPELIASFGTGAGRIDVRVIAQDGPAAFRAALSADLMARKASGAQLLRNRHIVASPSARAQLASGQVDSRLLTTIAFLAGQRPVDIVEFGSVAPGAGPGVPLRFADLAETDPAAGLSSSAYVRSLVALLHNQDPPYVPLSTGTVRLATGQYALRIEFAAPSPIGLLR
jgi:hypothetical protein